MTSDDVITCMVLVCHRNAFVFNSGSTYSCVSSYITLYMDMPRGSLIFDIHVSTLVGDFVVVDLIYQTCILLGL